MVGSLFFVQRLKDKFIVHLIFDIHILLIFVLCWFFLFSFCFWSGFIIQIIMIWIWFWFVCRCGFGWLCFCRLDFCPWNIAICWLLLEFWFIIMILRLEGECDGMFLWGRNCYDYYTKKDCHTVIHWAGRLFAIQKQPRRMNWQEWACTYH